MQEQSDAEAPQAQIQQALALSPDLPMAEASYGMLRVRQGRMEDARPYLEKAVAANSQNYLTHYYYAFALSSLSMNEYRVVSSYSPEVANTMRAELKKAIALKPDFPESYSLLGFVNAMGPFNFRPEPMPEKSSSHRRHRRPRHAQQFPAWLGDGVEHAAAPL